MFSFEYFFESIKLLIRYPMALMEVSKGREGVGHKIYLIRKQRYSTNPISEKHVKGLFIYLNPIDTEVISPSIAEDGLYELEETALFKKIVKKGFTVVDVGANIGWYTLLASKIVGLNGQVISFEPSPTNSSFLKKSICKNGFNNIKVFEICASNTNGTSKLYLGNRNMGGNSIKQKCGDESILVKTVTIDSILTGLTVNSIDLLKVDVEGAEPEVIEGAINYLRDGKIKNIFLEWNAQFWDDKTELLEEIKSKYLIYKFVKSPFLITKIDSPERLGDCELFLQLNSP